MIVNLTKLTDEQQQFASDNHYIVENFLKYRNLNWDEYYDIAVFGFLRAVKKYFLRPELWQYTFSTIAQYAMKTNLYNHRRKQFRQKRNAVVISLDNMTYNGSDLTFADITAARGLATDRLDGEILWNNITANLPDDCVEVLRMRIEGYTDREIAKNRRVPLKDINSMMEQIREIAGSMQA